MTRKLTAISILCLGIIIGAMFSSVDQSTATAETQPAQSYAVAYTMYDHMGEVEEVDGWTEEEANTAAAELKEAGYDNAIVFSYTPQS